MSRAGLGFYRGPFSPARLGFSERDISEGAGSQLLSGRAGVGSWTGVCQQCLGLVMGSKVLVQSRSISLGLLGQPHLQSGELVVSAGTGPLWVGGRFHRAFCPGIHIHH